MDYILFYVQIDYVVIAGDLESHADWAYTPASHTALIQNISATMRQYFPNLPIYFAIGNHEGVPMDT
jgi:sphingomyelin phosphodiesterase